jgi:Mn2+/Fe2+ NRAMP family transporter
MVFTYPLRAAIQMISARIGRVTGQGLAANMVRVFPRWLVAILVGLLFAANTINIGADLAVMGAAAKLVLGCGQHTFTLGFAALSLLLQVIIPYHQSVRYLKWLTLALFAYVGVVFAVHIDWGEVAYRTAMPQIALTRDVLTLVVAIFGTTISPYLFFWQASQEVEEVEGDPKAAPLLERQAQAPRELRRIHWDTYAGIGFSNLIAFFIILATVVTLHAAGKTDIEASQQAAEAIAGEFAFLLFSLGIIGTGLLAIPVLAGSAGYIVAESQGWKIGLEHQPREAIGFYSVIAFDGIGDSGGLFPDRSRQGPVLDRRDQRRHLRTDHGSDDGGCLAQKRDGPICRDAEPADSRLGRDGDHGFRHDRNVFLPLGRRRSRLPRPQKPRGGISDCH